MADEHNGTRPGILGLWTAPEIGKMVEEICTLEGYKVQRVRTADEAIRILEGDERSYIIAMDNVHVSAEAQQLLQLVRARPNVRARVGIVVMMAHHYNEWFESCARGGTLDAFLAMPFTLDQLMQVLDRLSAELHGGKPKGTGD